MGRSRRSSSLGACCLCLALLAASVQWSAAADAPGDGAKPTAAAGSSKPAARSSSSKTSSIIPSAGETKLVNGIGDVQPEGACKADVKALCKDVSPGDDRLLLCLVKRMKQAQQGNIAGRRVSEKCQQDVAKYKIERSQHINRDVALARACKEDTEKLCKSASDSSSPGSVVQCLRSSSKKVSPACKGELWRTQAEVAEDYRTDPQLYDKCKDSVQQLCKDVEPGSGGELDCLVSHSLLLTKGVGLAAQHAKHGGPCKQQLPQQQQVATWRTECGLRTCHGLCTVSPTAIAVHLQGNLESIESIWLHSVYASPLLPCVCVHALFAPLCHSAAEAQQGADLGLHGQRAAGRKGVRR